MEAKFQGIKEKIGCVLNKLSNENYDEIMTEISKFDKHLVLQIILEFIEILPKVQLIYPYGRLIKDLGFTKDDINVSPKLKVLLYFHKMINLNDIDFTVEILLLFKQFRECDIKLYNQAKPILIYSANEFLDTVSKREKFLLLDIVEDAF